MAPWGGVSSPFTGKLRPAGSGSRWPCGSCCLTWYRERWEGAGFAPKASVELEGGCLLCP